MTNAGLRRAGAPSPIEDGTHDAGDLGAAIPYTADEEHRGLAGFGFDLDRYRGGVGVLDTEAAAPVDCPPDPQPAALGRITGLIRPICVGALMAIPTVGTATVGLVAMFSEVRAMAMVRASTAFLAGIPSDIVLLIGALATGYGVAKSVERLKGAAS